PAPLQAQSTQIIGGEQRASLPELAALDAKRQAAAAGEKPLQAESTVIFDSATGSRPMPQVGPQASTMLAMPAPVLPQPTGTPAPGPVEGAAAPAPPIATPVGAGQLVAPEEGERSTLWKDIVIGIGVAAAVVAGIFGVRAYMSRSQPKATLVVMLSSATGGDVV